MLQSMVNHFEALIKNVPYFFISNPLKMAGISTLNFLLASSEGFTFWRTSKIIS